MRSNKKLQNEIGGLTTLGGVVESYQEIAALRMRRVKKSVLQNREFLAGLNDIYGQVSSQYKDSLPRLKKNKRIEIRPTINKTVSVLLSANTGLYGDIVKKTYDLFIEDMSKSDSDVVIVGRYGRKAYESSTVNKPFQYYDYSDSGKDIENTRRILEYILKYENIDIYHGFFKDILSQVPLKTSITGTNMFTSSEEGSEHIRSIYEPSIEEVLTFFEKEILSSLFEQSTYETSLSKYASRMVSLDYAMENIRVRLKQTDFKIRKLKHTLADRNQLSLLTGISMWKR
jgi:ATP synthase F1 gamma subunit